MTTTRDPMTPFTRTEAEELYERASSDARRRRGRRRTLRIGGASLSAALIAGALVWAFSGLSYLGSSSMPAASGPDPNYRFTDVTVDDAGGGSAEVTFGVAWATSEFPGVRRCAITVLDSTGAEIGRAHTRVISLTADALGDRTTQSVPVEGAPSSATISCGQRLDLGDPYAYAFDDLRVVIDDNHLVTMGTAPELVATVRWMGEGLPGAVVCTFAVLDSEGRVIAERHANFYSGESPVETRFTFDREGLSGPIPSSPDGLVPQISCVPFTGEPVASAAPEIIG
jgi:hypothetical protein